MIKYRIISSNLLVFSFDYGIFFNKKKEIIGLYFLNINYQRKPENSLELNTYVFSLFCVGKVVGKQRSIKH
jgi:hypothetical protein